MFRRASPSKKSEPSARPRRGALVYLLQAGILVVFLLIWQFASETGLVSPLFASSPSAILAKFVTMFGSGAIWPHVLATGQVLAMGFGLAVVVGVPLGLLLGRSQLLRAVSEPYVAAFYAAPQIAFLPLIILWLGIGLTSKVALVFLGSFIIILINTEAGVSQVDPRLIQAVRSFTASERQVLTKVILPSALPYIIAGIRLAVGRALVLVVVAEVYASTRGIGYLIFQAGGLYDTAQMFVGIGVLAGTGVAFNGLLRIIERRLAPWQMDLR